MRYDLYMRGSEQSCLSAVCMRVCGANAVVSAICTIREYETYESGTESDLCTAQGEALGLRSRGRCCLLEELSMSIDEMDSSALVVVATNATSSNFA